MQVFLNACACVHAYAYAYALHVCNIQRDGWSLSSRPTLGAEFNASCPMPQLLLGIRAKGKKLGDWVVFG